MYLKKFILIIGMMMTTITPASISFDNDNWNAVLKNYVDPQGYVDYLGLASNRTQFDQYLQAIKTTGPKSHPELFPSTNDKLAYYINAYNALVFEGVLNRGPEDKSVWRGLVSGLNFFIRMKVMLDGQTTNLKKLEDEIIRDEFKDPRIHAAINCASISCPRLPQQAFDAKQLDQQLDEAMREFVATQSNVQVDDANSRIYVSKIFDWFKDDFIDYERKQGNPAPDLISYINRYRAEDQQLPDDYKVKYFKYNKDINKQG